ncbi:MAG: AarF/UbiB family protein [Bacteriovorax sp.]|nr:AarF/UbiB family protein [Bacteriovorax sp.]
MNELICLASEERGILYKLLQHLYPEKIPAMQNQHHSIDKAEIISIIEKELKLKFYDHFTSISEPIICASIGQVHKAELKTGPASYEAVAIKIQYPNVKKSINSQMQFLKLAAAAAKFGPISKWNISIKSHLLQIEARLNEELDYNHELKNLLIVKNFNSHSNKKSITPFESYCSSQIFTQSWVEGVDLKFIEKNWNDNDRKLAAEQLIENYMKQIFKDGFFQGDTNFSNFIFQKTSGGHSEINVQWIDFGNWCTLPQEVQKSLYTLIFQTIKGDDLNYLGHFEKIGFDITKLRFFQNVLPTLVSILLEPFLIDRPYDLVNWELEERIDNLLGENKWWFRSSGNAGFLELMKSFVGIINILKFLRVNINWHKQFLKLSDQFNIVSINQQIPIYENSIPSISNLAKHLVIHIFKNSKEHVKIELPATSFLDLENFIPEDIKLLLVERSLDIQKIKFNYLKNGLVPGEVFSLEKTDSISDTESVITKFHVYLI